MPYSEPTWLSKAFHSPYYNDTHRTLQKAMRELVDVHVRPDARACEDNGKAPSEEVIKLLGENGVNAMRFGPGKHLAGVTLLGGIVKPEEFDCRFGGVISCLAS